MSSGLPVLLRSDHKILGSEYCSGYTDIFGKWNTGFYCPQTESKTAVSCCGIPTYKYCCTTRDPNDLGTTTENAEVSLAPYLIRTPVILGIVTGVFLMLVIVILTSCYFCSCCLCYRKRRVHIPPGLYRLPLASSSTTSGLLNVYSASSSFNSPLDMEWHQHVQRNLSSSAPNGHVLHHNNLNNQIGANAQLPPISRPHHGNTNQNPTSNRNGAIFTTQTNGWLTNSYSHQQQQPPYPYLAMSNGHSTLPRHFTVNHQGNNLNRYPSNSNSLRRPQPPPRIDNNAPAYYGFTTGNQYQSRPYVISNRHLDQFDPSRPRSVISFRNNVAYITSTLPLRNSFTTGQQPRRNISNGIVNPAPDQTGSGAVKNCNVNNTEHISCQSPIPCAETSPSVPEPLSVEPEHESEFKGCTGQAEAEPSTKIVSETEMITSFGTFPVKPEENTSNPTSTTLSNSSAQVLEPDTQDLSSRPQMPLIETHRVRL